MQTQPLAAETHADAQQILAAADAARQQLDVVRAAAEAGMVRANRVRSELRLAAKLQRDLLPKRLPSNDCLTFSTLFRPADHVGGDMFDVRRLDENFAGLLQIDAVGHGLPAALLAMYLAHAVAPKRAIAEAPGYRLLPPTEVLAELNRVLCDRELDGTTFATGLYAQVELGTGRVDFARGGHPRPLLLRKDADEAVEVTGDGALLGVVPDEVFDPASIQLEPGDRLLIFTDGVETIFPEAGGDAAAWKQAINRRLHLSGQAILDEIDGIIGQRPAEDDVTLIAIERH
jgi:serine phosphatase RsbU (regulator of sigma subunit)